MENLILYGPPCSGKYTAALELIRPYSKTELKYKRKLEIVVNQENYYFKVSDIHFEIDFELLGTNENAIWQEFILSVREIVKCNLNRCVILCRNFHFIKDELLSIFHTFMRDPSIKFILCTQHISYLPLSIKERCTITYLKQIRTESYGQNYIPLCNKVIELLFSADLELFDLRESLYQLLIHNLDVHQCLQYIYFETIKRGKPEIPNDTLLDIMMKYNTNYRSIYHLESFVLYIRTASILS
jgi:DNA polymerase III delta prime subunit